MPKSHAPYPVEFRTEAVQLVRSSGKAVAAIAADLGVSEPTLRQWIKQAEVDAGQRSGPTTDELSELRRLRRENLVLRQEREILKKAAAFFVRENGQEPEIVTLHRFVDAEKAHYPVTPLCHVLGVSRSGFYAWSTRGPSNHERRDRVLIRYIRMCHDQSRHTYGAPRIHAELRLHHGIHCSKKRVARLMRKEGLVAAHRRHPEGCTRRDERRPVLSDLVGRQFAQNEINRLWVADITQHPTAEGWLYTAVVQDACSRRIVGWAMDDHLRAELVVDALDMAVQRREPKPGHVVHHSDHGSQYTSIAFGDALKKSRITGSMGKVGDALDNAMAESFNATLQTELLDTRPSWPTRRMLKSAIEYIEVFYNRQRRHSALGYLSPQAFKASLADRAQDAG